MRRRSLLLLLALLAPLAASAQDRVQQFTIIDDRVGDGFVALEGMHAAVTYTGWVYDADAPDHKGRQFDASMDPDNPFVFRIGTRRVIRGWNMGLPGMRIGGKRTLLLPPEDAYGAEGAPPMIPPYASLIFEIELHGLEQR
ncbi:FKBP-type peptidyl-prolyl cis-trans isomerase [Coralloluteibacterium stylophorae]|uniref:Peptidyl-prolyl cis-trans isomerase n=1 Tax=Coralloluteibacterium stylophorae TaxID=1776034 RepID=A0A8J7VY57_9GAMM|nr:FKBP-type peptidyl-prolyl cis-trans isomerase [Coralloluteibacterium stylophorae]MBS7457512.1 FKBP-type peptidyl-prolyl cis-trans isomerase [Coralloluteibacterium stylophorae]